MFITGFPSSLNHTPQALSADESPGGVAEMQVLIR